MNNETSHIKENQMNGNKMASEMTNSELAQYVLQHSVVGDPDNSLYDWIANSIADLDEMTADDVVIEWDAER